MTFADTMRAALAGYGPRHCIEFEGTWYTGTDLERWMAATDVAPSRFEAARREAAWWCETDQRMRR